MVHKTSGAQKHLALLETALRLAHPWRYAENMAAGLERYWSGNEKAGKIVREMYISLQLLIIVLKLTKKMEPLFLLSIYQESRILILKDYIEICKLDSIFIQINLLYI